MYPTIDQLIREAGELPPLPRVAQKALEMLHAPEVKIEALANVLSVDQVLAGLTLKWANSAYYGLQKHVATIQQAIIVLGLDALQGMLLASPVAQYMNRPLPGYELRQGELWRHSLGVAIGSKLIAQQRGWPFSDEAYYAGLLCDIGKLAFEKLIRGTDTSLPEWQVGPFLEMERTHFGIDHAALGSEMARRWNFPASLVNAIAYHHNPENITSDKVLVSVVHVADAAMMMLGVGIGKDGLQYHLEPEALKRLDMGEKDLLDLLEQILSHIEMAELFIGFD